MLRLDWLHFIYFLHFSHLADALIQSDLSAYILIFFFVGWIGGHVTRVRISSQTT